MLKRDDIDVVDIAVPISENFEVARDVLSVGKNIIAEKPLAATLEGAEELIRLKNTVGAKVMVAENFRYDEGNNRIKEMITNGKIGDILYFILNTGADFKKEMLQDEFGAKEWRQHPQFEGGMFLDGGIHDIALMRFLFGDVESVYSLGKKHDEEFCPYAVISSVIKFKNGVAGNYSYYSSGKELQKPPIGLRIFGTQGDVYLESKESGVINLNLTAGGTEQVGYAPNRGYYNEFLNFYEGNIVSTPEKEVGDMELVFNILKSVEKSEVVIAE
jgi:predicted dehydrogenase